MQPIKQSDQLPHIQSASGLVASAKAEIREIEPAAAADLVAEGALLLDVREREELMRDGMIAGALHAPRGLLEWYVDPQHESYLRELDPTRPLIVYCRSGGRSALAAQQLGKMGYGDVTSLQGGITRWKAEGRPVAAPQATP